MNNINVKEDLKILSDVINIENQFLECIVELENAYNNYKNN